MQDIEYTALLWLLVCTCIAFFMQAGFTLVETGSIRAKNSVNVAMKNLADFIVVTVTFTFVGFPLTQGSSFFSFETFPVHQDQYPILLFNLMFVTTAATIVSGCVAERMSFRGYIYASAFVGVVTYPVVAYWTWNPNAWLYVLGFHDFAGGATVHVVGGMLGLLGTMIIGSRKDRFTHTKNVNEIPSYNHTLVTLGVFLMVFAWLGFNGGSLYQFDERVSTILFNTLLCGTIAGFCTLCMVHRRKHVPVFVVLNSVLGGLVIVTSCADVARTWDVVVLGVMASFVVRYGDQWLIRWRIDDPVGAIPVHLFCGACGVVYTALLLNTSSSVFSNLGVQAFGLAIILLWTGLNAYVCFRLLKFFKLDRISEKDEQLGLNISEHGIKMSWLETLRVIENISREGDYSKRVPVEVGTEAGDVAQSFNHLMDRLESNIQVLHKVAKGKLEDINIVPSSDKDIMANSLFTMIDCLRSLRDEVEDEIGHQAQQLESNEHSIQTLIEKFKSSKDQLMEAEKMSALTGMVVGVAHELNTPLGISVTSLSILSEKLNSIEKKFSDKSMTTDDLSQFLNIVTECLDLLTSNIERSVALVSKLKQVNQKMSGEAPTLMLLKQTLDEAILHVSDTLKQHRIEVELQCDEAWQVFLPVFSLQCAVEELLINSALHAFGEDKVSDDRRVTITAHNRGDDIIITIEDNGVGISVDHKKKVFQPFFTTLRARGGTGLGLHMVYNICTQKLRGTIELHSEVAKGTTFILCLKNSANNDD
ncbi:ATP-binding protein [Vibrio ostreicida]|uniref:histidine kinase n=1 Tax=Vibrio ostreicida TaxID=526588 RepID=A0ABT8C1J2_9VIBR|nr:ATP-binding protein [Vibrio ostreicida]MDN3612484.1 ATP-binding protein [Vibrio ostreicida]NPD10191.1 HAMP domain-containing protein [Vibrio ostreicida]